MAINISNPFSLKSSVGWNGSNDRTDVAKVEYLLGRTGDLNLKETDGLTGYYGARVEQAGKRYQKRNNLKQDGHFNPGGESIRSLRTQLAENDKAKSPLIGPGGEGQGDEKRAPKDLPLILEDPGETWDTRMNTKAVAPGTRDKNDINPLDPPKYNNGFPY